MIFTDEYINGIILKVEEASKNKDKDYFCSSRDVFQVRIDSYALGTSKYLESAIIGEIGNNTFDHNWDFAEGHARGTYLNLYDFENTVILADFGRGIRKSLERVYQAKDDKAALEIAFTQQISGRAPEQRGNGLKFVLENMQKKNWDLYFQSGIGCCIISDGIVTFKENNVDILGCLAILVFDGGKDEYTNK
jgi:hypothetical protein